MALYEEMCMHIRAYEQGNVYKQILLVGSGSVSKPQTFLSWNYLFHFRYFVIHIYHILNLFQIYRYYSFIINAIVFVWIKMNSISTTSSQIYIAAYHVTCINQKVMLSFELLTFMCNHRLNYQIWERLASSKHSFIYGHICIVWLDLFKMFFTR